MIPLNGQFDSLRKSLYEGAQKVGAHRPQDYSGEDLKISNLRRARSLAGSLRR
jgi:hypothetical protein